MRENTRKRVSSIVLLSLGIYTLYYLSLHYQSKFSDSIICFMILLAFELALVVSYNIFVIVFDWLQLNKVRQ